MTEIPVFVSTDEISVAGVVEQIELSVSTGAQGQRGTHIFNGTLPPQSISINDPVFSGFSEFIDGDMYFQYGDEGFSLWQWSVSQGVWVKQFEWKTLT